MRTIFFLLLPLLFLGCLSDETTEQTDSISTQKQAVPESAHSKQMTIQNEKLQQKQIEAKQQKDMAEISMKKELASINQQGALELAKLDAELQMQRLVLEKEQALEQLKQQNLIRESEQALSLKRYILFFSSLILIILAGAVYYFMKRRREDKLQAYNDNLEKYFQNKQNESRVKIAEKIIDTIATGKLNSQQESQLIEAINGENRHHDDPDVDDADIIEQLPNKS